MTAGFYCEHFNDKNPLCKISKKLNHFYGLSFIKKIISSINLYMTAEFHLVRNDDIHFRWPLHGPYGVSNVHMGTG